MAAEAHKSPEERLSQVNDVRWRKVPVLDDGFVCLVDVMGDDGSVVQAARVSYGEGTKRVSDDRTLIRYLLRHRHTTPFEMVELKFLVRVPMDCWRQWIRHRTANVNEYSTRYSLAIDAAQQTPQDEWRAQAESNRQGSEGSLQQWPDFEQLKEENVQAAAADKPPKHDPEAIARLEQLAGSESPGDHFTRREHELQQLARQTYEDRLVAGIAREQARKDLPLSTYTEAYWKIDLHNLLHFLALRMDSHAQLEIREYATAIGEQIVAPLFPIVWEAFCDYRMNSSFLTGLDVGVIQRLTAAAAAAGMAPPFTEDAFLEAQDPTWSKLKRSRERDECRSKLQKLGLLPDTE